MIDLELSKKSRKMLCKAIDKVPKWKGHYAYNLFKHSDFKPEYVNEFYDAMEGIPDSTIKFKFEETFERLVAKNEKDTINAIGMEVFRNSGDYILTTFKAPEDIEKLTSSELLFIYIIVTKMASINNEMHDEIIRIGNEAELSLPEKKHFLDIFKKKKKEIITDSPCIADHTEKKEASLPPIIDMDPLTIEEVSESQKKDFEDSRTPDLFEFDDVITPIFLADSEDYLTESGVKTEEPEEIESTPPIFEELNALKTENIEAEDDDKIFSDLRDEIEMRLTEKETQSIEEPMEDTESISETEDSTTLSAAPAEVAMSMATSDMMTDFLDEDLDTSLLALAFSDDLNPPVEFPTESIEDPEEEEEQGFWEEEEEKALEDLEKEKKPIKKAKRTKAKIIRK